MYAYVISMRVCMRVYNFMHALLCVYFIVRFCLRIAGEGEDVFRATVSS